MTIQTIDGKSFCEALASNYRETLPRFYHGKKGTIWTMETFTTYISLRYPQITVDAGQEWVRSEHKYNFTCEDHGPYSAYAHHMIKADQRCQCRGCKADSCAASAGIKRSPRLTSDEKEQINKLYADGLSYREIGRQVDRDHSVIIPAIHAVKAATEATRSKVWYANNKDRAKQTRDNYQKTLHGAAVAERQAIKRRIAKQNIDPVVYIDGIAHDVDLKETWAVFSKALITEDEARAIAKLQRQKRGLTKQTGIPHHLDHIHPLSKGGEHSPFNLQIITKEENLAKSDTFREEDQIELCKRLFNIN